MQRPLPSLSFKNQRAPPSTRKTGLYSSPKSSPGCVQLPIEEKPASPIGAMRSRLDPGFTTRKNAASRLLGEIDALEMIRQMGRQDVTLRSCRRIAAQPQSDNMYKLTSNQNVKRAENCTCRGVQ